MSAPRASDIASRTGVAQSVIHSKTPRTDKKAEEARSRTVGGGDEEEGSSGQSDKPEKSGQGGKASGANAAKFGQEERQQVKRKRVKLSELKQKKTTATQPKAEAAKPEATQAQARQEKAEAADVGRQIAQQKLNERGKLAETQHRYQAWANQSRQDSNNALSPQGQQRQMLNNLIRYQECNYLQHTGDKAGEIYNRPATRQILQALQGLRNGGGSGKTESTSSSTTSASTSPAAFKAKTREANKMLEMFMLADKQPPPGYEPLEHVA